MRILFFSHYFPPEVNAPAIRTYEHCRLWVQAGHEVHVVTCVPSHPAGVPFPGYRRSWYRMEETDGVRVHRVWTYLAANQGVVRRALNYIAYVPTAVWRALRLGRFDVIVATSPQFFCAVAGGIAASLKRTPWVFELRDLWPDSIAAVGAIRRRALLRLLERLELALYRRASVVACLTRSFAENLERRGIPVEKLVYLPNGVDPVYWSAPAPAGTRERYGAQPDQIVASYVGTVGMAHGLGTLLDAAGALQTTCPSARIFIVGDGARRRELESSAVDRGLSNVVFTGLVPHADARDLLVASDLALVLLRKTPLFETVIPSKMLEAFASGIPVILGVGGEARRILEEAGAGVAITPEDSEALAAAISHLATDKTARRRMGESGRLYAGREFNRAVWSARYLELLEKVRSQE